MKLSEVQKIRRKSLALLKKAGITVTRQEAKNIEVADFGLNDFRTIGLGLITYENNDRYCAKELIMFPRQACPEHRHPPMDERNSGKQETFRCRWGKVYLYAEGPATAGPKAKVSKKYRPFFTVWKEVVLKPGDQYTLPPNTLHWFQAGKRGAVVSEFSSASHDETDLFTDPNINRLPVYEQ
jgi:D-lyxose ketol-isomerase